MRLALSTIFIFSLAGALAQADTFGTISATSGLNCRSGAHAWTGDSGSFSYGGRVTILGRSGNWYRVVCPNGQPGYVYSSYVRPSSPPQTANVPLPPARPAQSAAASESPSVPLPPARPADPPKEEAANVPTPQQRPNIPTSPEDATTGSHRPGHADSGYDAVPGNYTYSNIKLTGYSSNCHADHFGGGDHSSSDPRLKPSAHTVDGSSAVVETACPQIGGTASLYKCFFELIPPASASADLKDAAKRKVFFCGDHYARSSNHMMKLDVSMTCPKTKEGVKKLNGATFNGAKVRRLNCVGPHQNVLEAVADMEEQKGGGSGTHYASSVQREVASVSGGAAGTK